jgi:hypothetical protein
MEMHMATPSVCRGMTPVSVDESMITLTTVSMGMWHKKPIIHHVIWEIFYLPTGQQPRVWNLSPIEIVNVHLSHEASMWW